ncbi:unnamed protein product [Meloidogyne enterolobii]|uniref:Uncharacterized protein n=1 Tax=Meloidogyne enterolobii TaxID=390850 RepID=A0ACB0XLK6_MELEN
MLFFPPMTDFPSTEHQTTVDNNLPLTWLNDANTSSILSRPIVQEQQRINSTTSFHQLLLMGQINQQQISQSSLLSLPPPIGLNVFPGLLTNGGELTNKREEEERNKIFQQNGENLSIVPLLGRLKSLDNEHEFKSQPETLPNNFQMSMAPTGERLLFPKIFQNFFLEGPCALCHLPIVEKHFLVVDSQCWHTECVRCAVCSRNLEDFKDEEGQSNCGICFARDGFLFCRRDYLIKYGKKCERCNSPIERGNLVMRVPVNGKETLFHIQCFVCVCCGRPLQPGEQYMVGPFDEPGGSLFCSEHFHLNPAIHRPSAFLPDFQPLNCRTEPTFLTENNLCSTNLLNQQPTSEHSPNSTQKLISHRPPLSMATNTSSNEFIVDYDNNYDATTNTFTSSVAGSTTPNSRGGAQSEDINFGNSNLSDSGDPLSSSNNSAQKLKRMRTSFKHTQLRTMKAYFFINHNPDSKDLKILSNKTGLSKRNARAKYRRSQQNQLGTSSMAASVHLLEHQRSDNSTQQFLGLTLGQQQNNCGLSTSLDETYRPNKIEQQQIQNQLLLNSNSSPINSSNESITISLNACSIDEQNSSDLQ